MAILPANQPSQKSNPKEGLDLDQLQQKERPRILVIDDELDTVILLKHVLMRGGFDVSGAVGGKEAISKIAEIKPSLILLDLMMPELDGWQTFQQIHELEDIPVIVISALTQSETIVKALQMGADDYITKPFDQAEVNARINAVLRRASKPRVFTRLGFSEIQLVIDLETQEITYQGNRIQLTGKMFEVLEILAKNAPHVTSYEDIATRVWGENNPSVRNRLKYLIYLLRLEFERIDKNHNLIKNVDRLGYKLVTEE
jgi:DNA-binding response OmpR family regulator